jgi:2-hydroxy-3-oxopropionate reductase
MAKIGFVGLGIMGKPMARNLMKAGHSLAVYDIRPEPVKELTGEGARAAASAREAAAGAEVTITMVPDSPDSERAILGPGGVLEGAGKGSVIIDMSSINPLVSQRIAREVQQKGVEFLDAPVSGGEPGAIQGTLAIMVGGKQQVFDRCTDILKVMGKSVVRVGDVGAGNVTKLANQIIVAANISALSEALVLATKAGLDPRLVFQAIRGGLAGSNVMEAKAPMILAGNFKPGFRIRLHQKDLHNAILAGKDLGVPLPVTALVQQMLTSLMTAGRGDYDHSGIVTFLEDLAKVQAREKAKA